MSPFQIASIADSRSHLYDVNAVPFLLIVQIDQFY